ncbi:MAG: alpha/beta fold hydrolase [Deltaproteobacteria bacterium]|nr:alpha/beta fold hydrolase [Deltaproteobacteria bacterium]
MVKSETMHVNNGDGWQLGLVRVYDPVVLEKKRKPVVIVPGYGMNGFIFTYHPSGKSLSEAMAERGLEVWIANLRGQDPSFSTGGGRDFNLQDLALKDLPAILKRITSETLTGQEDVDLIGASLGGTIAFIYMALGNGPAVHALVAIGSPLRWEAVHPLVRIVFGNAFLAALLPTRGIRSMARVFLPLLEKMPYLLSMYLHPELVDLKAAPNLVRTVENPSKALNLQISSWIRKRDLIINGNSLTDSFRRTKSSILCVVAKGDGIVPRPTATSALKYCDSDVREVLEIGDRQKNYAHADLFVGKDAEQDVFTPIADWLMSLART